MNKARKTYFLMLLLVLLFLFAIYRYTSVPKEYNVLLIVSDALRADVIGCYGGDAKTPNIDWLAEHGVLFERAYSTSPWTAPSSVSMFTGEYPDIYQKGMIDESLRGYYVPDGKLLLAEVLEDMGYEVGEHLENPFAKACNALQGFKGITGYEMLLRQKKTHVIENICGIRPESDYYKKMYGPLDFIVKFSKNQPFFLLKWILDPHGPYDPPEKYYNGRNVLDIKNITKDFQKILAALSELIKKDDYDSIDDYLVGVLDDTSYEQSSLKKLYEEGIEIIKRELHKKGFDQTIKALNEKRVELLRKEPHKNRSKSIGKELYESEVEFVDERIGFILNALRNKDLFDNTYVVFTSDHGEFLGEHGQWGHGKYLYEDVLRVPLIITGPGVSKGERQKKVVSLLNLMPTLKDLLGLKYQDNSQGKSFSGLLFGNPVKPPSGAVENDRFAYFVEAHDRSQQDALLENNYKLIVFRDNTHKLYNLSDDPDELKDISKDNPQVVKRMLMRVEKIRDENNKRRVDLLKKTKKDVELDKETLERIRALGYLN
jgi:arylsulfatase A-like enzyme